MEQQPGQGTILLMEPLEGDSGQYQCFAENTYGIATSNSVFVRVDNLNATQLVQTMTVTAIEGAPFLLECQPPNDWIKTIVYWIKLNKTDETIAHPLNENLILGRNDTKVARLTLDQKYNLYFSSVTHDDASNGFDYACVALSTLSGHFYILRRVDLSVLNQNEVNAIESTTLSSLRYLSSNIVITQLGEEIILFCIFGGKSNSKVKWQKDGNLLTLDERVFLLSSDKSLKIRNTIPTDAGTYICESFDDFGEIVNHSIDLIVNSPAHFLIKPENKVVLQGETVEFKCIGSGIPSIELKWTFNGKPIENASQNSRRIMNINSILIENVTLDDVGNYGCNVSNSLGYVYEEAYLNALDSAPEFIDLFNDHEIVFFKDEVTLRCPVSGNPFPEIKWYRNGREFDCDQWTFEIHRYVDCKLNGDLHFFGTIWTDAGEYTCVAHNKWGSMEASVSLIVLKHTTAMTRFRKAEVFEGETVKLECDVTADPTIEVHVEWNTGFNGDKIDFENNPRFVKTEKTLTIYNITENDEFQYNCYVSTGIDEDEAESLIYVQKNQTKSFLLDLKCDSRHAKIEWVDDLVEIPIYTLRFNRSDNPENWINVADNIQNRTVIVSIIPWMNYTFSLTSKNQDGLPISRIHSCNSKFDRPFKNPENVKGRGTNPTNLIISWSPVPQIEHNGPGFHYRVYWRRNSTEAHWKIENVHDWQNNSIEIENQPTFQCYEIKVKSVNDLGESSTETVQEYGYSGEGWPIQAPTNLHLINVTEHSADLAWSPVANDTINGHFKGYNIEIRSIDGAHITAHTNNNQISITPLKENTKYFAQVSVKNSVHEGPYSEEITIETIKSRSNNNGMFFYALVYFELANQNFLLYFFTYYNFKIIFTWESVWLLSQI